MIQSGNEGGEVLNTTQSGSFQECVEAYEYPECAGSPFISAWEGLEEIQDDTAFGGTQNTHGRNGLGDLEARMAEETQSSYEAGRKRGIEEGRGQEQAARALDEERRIRQAAALAAEFSRQRDSYFQAAEQEVVRLAVAVAARILRRQAQADPLLLMGAVRVALGQIAANSEVRIYIPKADHDLWTEAIALLPNLTVKPQVIADDAMRLGECRMETALGKSDLGIPSQLAEIERSFSADNKQSAHSSTRSSQTVEVEEVEAEVIL